MSRITFSFVSACVIASAIMTTPAAADQWQSYYDSLTRDAAAIVPQLPPPVNTVALEADVAHCNTVPQPGARFNTLGGSGCTGTGNVYITLSAFATQDEFEDLSQSTARGFYDLNKDIAILSSQLQQINQAAHNFAWTTSALSSSFVTTLPEEGTENHIAFGFAAGGNARAMSLNYVHVQDEVDFQVGVATTGYESLARASVGFSW